MRFIGWAENGILSPGIPGCSEVSGIRDCPPFRPEGRSGTNTILARLACFRSGLGKSLLEGYNQAALCLNTRIVARRPGRRNYRQIAGSQTRRNRYVELVQAGRAHPRGARH